MSSAICIHHWILISDIVSLPSTVSARQLIGYHDVITVHLTQMTEERYMFDSSTSAHAQIADFCILGFHHPELLPTKLW
jgi:hypothetical protein